MFQLHNLAHNTVLPSILPIKVVRTLCVIRHISAAIWYQLQAEKIDYTNPFIPKLELDIKFFKVLASTRVLSKY